MHAGAMMTAILLYKLQSWGREGGLGERKGEGGRKGGGVSGCSKSVTVTDISSGKLEERGRGSKGRGVYLDILYRAVTVQLLFLWV